MAAWLYTLSVYCAASNVATVLFEVPCGQAAAQISSISTEIGGHMKPMDVISSARSRDTDLDIGTYFNQPGIEFHNNGTVIGVAHDKASFIACENLVNQSQTMKTVCNLRHMSAAKYA